MTRTGLSRRCTRALSTLICAGALLALAAPAMAVVPGANGRIVFTSGRAPAADDSKAQLWVLDPPTAAGTPTRITIDTSVQFRHAAWSPDARYVTYARGAVGAWGIYIQNVRTGSASSITLFANAPEDRPAWSPDGTKIAYQGTVGGQTDIFVRPIISLTPNIQVGPATNITNTPAESEEKPEWTPNSAQIYYSSNSGGELNIYRVAATGGLRTGVLTQAGSNDFQPALSPNGTRMCFTKGGFTNQANVYTVAASGAGQQTKLSDDDTTADYNCAWSPDGTKIAYARGLLTAGALGVKPATGGQFDVYEDVVGRFDGNPNWAVDLPPTCQNVGVVPVAFNKPAQVNLNCTDPEGKPLTYSVVNAPDKGVTSSIDNADGTLMYIPNLDAQGNDSFTYRASDGASNSNTATVTLRIAPPGQNPPNTPAGGSNPPSGGGRDRLAAVISGVAVSPFAWRRGLALPRVSGLRRSPVGTTIRFRLSEAAQVRLTFGRAVLGRRVARTCRPATRARRFLPRCLRYRAVGTVSFAGRPGLNRFRFAGRLSRTRRLGLGLHQVTINATDIARNRSRPRTARFRIVAR